MNSAHKTSTDALFTICPQTKTLLRKRKFTEYRRRNLQEVLKSSQNKKHYHLKTILIAKGTDCNTELNVIVLRILHNDRSFRTSMQHGICICNLWHWDTVITNITHSGVRVFLKTEALGNLTTFHDQFCVDAVFLARLHVRNIIKWHFLRKDSKPRTTDSNQGLSGIKPLNHGNIITEQFMPCVTFFLYQQWSSGMQFDIRIGISMKAWRLGFDSCRRQWFAPFAISAKQSPGAAQYRIHWVPTDFPEATGASTLPWNSKVKNHDPIHTLSFRSSWFSNKNKK
jgi:hypothetical protein